MEFRKDLVMKKMVIAFIMILHLCIAVFSDNLNWGGLYQSPNTIVSASIGYESFSSSYIFPLTAGAEMLLFKPLTGSVAPMDIGAAVRIKAGFGIGDISGLYLGAGAGATFHMGFNGLGTTIGIQALDKTEIFMELGACADFVKPDDEFLLGILARSGVRYLITDNILAEAAYTHWRGANGGSVGVCLMLGKAQQVSAEKLDLHVRDIRTTPYLMQFQAFYLYSFFAGGFYFDDTTYKPGDGTIWEIRSTDSGDVSSFTIQRALVASQPDGSKWWKIIITPEKEKNALLYEFLVDEDMIIKRIVFKEPDSGEVLVLSEGGDFAGSAASAQRLNEKDYAGWVQGKQKINVKAGSFQTDYIKYELADEEQVVLYEWWINKQVPGTMVRFHWQDGSDARVDGELVKILVKQISELNAF